MTAMEGKILHNRYKILRPVGVGGMAEVYLAQDMLLDREVAVKILRASSSTTKACWSNFVAKPSRQHVSSIRPSSIFLMYAEKTAPILS